MYLSTMDSVHWIKYMDQEPRVSVQCLKAVSRRLSESFLLGYLECRVVGQT
jgi:hypothetical protein